MTDLDARLGSALAELPLKEMEGALLAAALLRAAEPLDASGAVRRAVELAAYAHRDATRARRGPLPRDSYITHPLRGALRLHRWGVRDVDVLVAAVLHDVVEDAAPDLLDLVGLPVPADDDEGGAAQAAASALRDVVAPAFGARVAAVVEAVSNPPGPRPEDPEARRRAYRDHVLEAVRGDAAALLVKTSDLYDNAGSLHHHAGEHPEQVRRLAAKYAPLLRPVREELARVRPLPEDVLEELLTDLRGIEEGLEQLLSASSTSGPPR
ncbi:HD domain-containing protein [Quadrisphaera setariae]|uniref:HD domain-containing protein n=1 Tax=Quadrisphaera setariae TaxID=2593304 RepID=A0A5C8Z3D5_9ACTN|nr:HD domain-containing protein [Quadrisphaera setariae]TXR51733.1 HD domain-containing protein [Quadrisphaera setariae]